MHVYSLGASSWAFIRWTIITVVHSGIEWMLSIDGFKAHYKWLFVPSNTALYKSIGGDFGDSPEWILVDLTFSNMASYLMYARQLVWIHRWAKLKASSLAWAESSPERPAKTWWMGWEVGGSFKWQIHQLLRIINHILIVTSKTHRQDMTAGKLNFEGKNVI